MGGDHAPQAIIDGAIAAAKSGIPVVLIGDSGFVRSKIDGIPNIGVIHAEEHIGMDDKPVESIRRKSGASMLRAIELVKDGAAGAAVSCGNSGAFVVGAVLELKTIDGVERPAIATVLPRGDGGRLVLLDAGANIDCRPEMLARFALLGVALAQVLGVTKPRVGVLSNGAEETKGNALIQAALPLIRALPIEVVGHMEPSEALKGACDVLVCDGFMGNVLIKSAEGAVDTVLTMCRDPPQSESKIGSMSFKWRASSRSTACGLGCPWWWSFVGCKRNRCCRAWPCESRGRGSEYSACMDGESAEPCVSGTRAVPKK